MTKRARAGWLIVAVMAAVCARPVRAQQTPNIGKVEMDQVFAKFEYFKEKAKEFQELSRRLNAEFDERRVNFPLLLDEEYNKLIELRNKAPLSADEKKEFERLTRLGDDRDAQLARLSVLEDNKITAEEKKLRQQLMAIRTQAQEQQKAMGEKHQATLAKQDEDMSKEVRSRMEAAAKAIAAENNLIAVLQSDVVLFGGIDITDKVVERLNAKPK
ncbi:MAG: OmpH family outer membrane protein [Armatimonadetes bacterium]|nr:OmpH family outer membrane protein [Armatimonadota bacterium]